MIIIKKSLAKTYKKVIYRLSLFHFPTIMSATTQQAKIDELYQRHKEHFYWNLEKMVSKRWIADRLYQWRSEDDAITKARVRKRTKKTGFIICKDPTDWQLKAFTKPPKLDINIDTEQHTTEVVKDQKIEPKKKDNVMKIVDISMIVWLLVYLILVVLYAYMYYANR